MTEDQRRKKLDRAQVRVVLNLPFFAAGVAKLPVVWDDTIPTACTDGQQIRWNPTWFDSLDQQVCVTVLCHEVCHCLLGHLWRAPSTGCDWDVWNQATDHATNGMLKEFGQTFLSKGMADPLPMPDGALCDPRYRNMSEEAIYGLLMSQNRTKSGKQPGAGPPSADGAGASGPGTGQKGSSKASKPSHGPGNATAGQSGGFGQITKPPGSQVEQKGQKADWDATLLQSVAACKGRGSLPGSLARYVSELVTPKVPWTELLRSFLRERVQDDYNWMVPNAYYDETGFILPSLDSEAMGGVVFCWDRSGSIDAKIDAAFLAECQAALDDLKPRKLVTMTFDTRVTSQREYRVGDIIESQSGGGGGTDFSDCFRKCNEMTEPPKCVVFLTDGDGSMDENISVPYPVLWVLTADKKMPFGQSIYAPS